MPAVVIGAPAVVIGSVAAGSAVAAGDPPVLIAGQDGTNVQTIRTATDGTVRTDPTGTTTQPVSAAALPLPTGAATSALQTQPGVDIGDVTVNNAAGAAAVNIQDGGNSLTVDGTVTANQGTAAALADGWPVKVTDGTNTMPTGDALARSIFHQISDGTTGPVAVKAASTTPVAADKALTVSLSPNSAPLNVTTVPASTTPNLIFGNVTLAAITTAAIEKTTYTEQSANFTGSIVSASANDAAAGTGARTVRIYYMNATGATAGTEDVTLNGITAVNLVTTTKCFIERMEVLTAGSGSVNAGIITLKTGAAGAGTTVGTIAAGDNVTFWAHHYVVTGKVCNITGALMGSTATNTAGICLGFIRAKTIGLANAIDKQVSDPIVVAALANAQYRSYNSQIKVTGPARVTMQVTTLNGSSYVYYGSFDAYDA